MAKDNDDRRAAHDRVAARLKDHYEKQGKVVNSNEVKQEVRRLAEQHDREAPLRPEKKQGQVRLKQHTVTARYRIDDKKKRWV